MNKSGSPTPGLHGGVTCGNDYNLPPGQVAFLNLDNNQLTGSISAELGNLSRLGVSALCWE